MLTFAFSTQNNSDLNEEIENLSQQNRVRNLQKEKKKNVLYFVLFFKALEGDKQQLQKRLAEVEQSNQQVR